MTSLKDRIKQLTSERSMSIAELERKLDFANGSISKWDKQSPSMERITAVADYFNVTTDYLIGRKSASANEVDSKTQLLAAHIDDNVSDEEMAQILDYIELVKKANRN